MKMRKILAVLVAAVMVLSMVPVMVLSVSAVDLPGDWDTFRNGEEYTEVHEVEGYKPAPGYHYTDDGFQTIRPDYTDTSPYFNVLTKEKQSVKDGIYLEMRVDEYSYSGDHWIGFSVWSSTELAPGNTNYGSGWLGMVRAPGNGGSSNVQSSVTLKKEEDTAGYFRVVGETPVTPTLDSEGHEIYTMEITYDNGLYNISICGVPVAGASDITTLLDQLDENGDFHVGVTLYSTEKDGNATLTILKYGASAESAEKPVGSDSKEPEENINKVADMMDESTVGENKPALLFNAVECGAPMGFGCDITAQGDDSFHVAASGDSAYIIWNVKKSMSYDAADFPVVALMFRSFDGMGGTCYFSAGDVMSADAEHMISFGLWDDGSLEYEDEEGVYYNMVTIDLTGLWEGRINALRFDFSEIDVSDEDLASWDFCWSGVFRSVDEAQAYSEAWYSGDEATNPGEQDTAEADTDASEEQGTVADEQETNAPADQETDASEEQVTAADEQETKAPAEQATVAEKETEAEAKTQAEAGTNAAVEGTDTTAVTSAAEEGGCASVIGAVAVLLTTAAAAVVLRKKD